MCIENTSLWARKKAGTSARMFTECSKREVLGHWARMAVMTEWAHLRDSRR